MPAPTNPKKKSLMPSTPLRRALQPIVQIGHHGVTEAVAKQVQQALFDHELVKVKLGSECPQDRFEVAERLGEGPGVQIAQILGRTLLLYKRHPQRPRYEGGRARAAADDLAEATARKSSKAKAGDAAKRPERPKAPPGRVGRPSARKGPVQRLKRR
jgi:RNA-binding protein